MTTTRLIHLLWWLIWLTKQLAFSDAKEHVFVVIPKSVDNPFFNASKAGCEDSALMLNVSCWFTGPLIENATEQEALVESMLFNKTISGVAISATTAETMTPVINKLVEAKIPVVTFDSDAPESKRRQYIGTDNFLFGQQLAGILMQIQPRGGTFAVLGTNSTNILERIRGFHAKLEEHADLVNWVELEGSPSDFQANLTLAMEQMQSFANLNPTAIVPVLGAPMRSGTWVDFYLENKFQEIALISGDAMPNQLAYFDRGYVDALLGQIPYDMGFQAIVSLHKLAEGEGEDMETIQGTNLISHVRTPSDLPVLVVDTNLIGGLVAVGMVLLGAVVFCALAFIAWTLHNRSLYIVQASQPLFLIMVAVGALIWIFCIVPLSLDDNGDESFCENHPSKCVAMCMSFPWLGCIGFTTVFGALYSKTARINKIFHHRNELYARVKVTERDVLLPYCTHLAFNVIILICWTIFDPFTYSREALEGVDGWNRLISTYGSCKSNNIAYYAVPLALINAGVLVLANYQAYEAREIHIEFSESRYIAIVMGTLLQAGLLGIPVVFLVKQNPQVYYLVQCFIIFVCAMSTLLLIFLPKVYLAEHYKRMPLSEQRRMIRRSIQRATVLSSKRRNSLAHGSGNFSSSALQVGSNAAGEHTMPHNDIQRTVQLVVRSLGPSMNDAFDDHSSDGDSDMSLSDDDGDNDGTHGLRYEYIRNTSESRSTPRSHFPSKHSSEISSEAKHHNHLAPHEVNDNSDNAGPPSPQESKK